MALRACSAPCGTPARWHAATTAAALHANETGHRTRELGFRRWRDPSKRRAIFASVCGKIGVHCEFMPTGHRWMIPGLAQTLKFTGPSVEVGVYRGAFSMEIMNRWPSGGRHLLVDAWSSFNASCNHAAKKNKHKLGDKQCRFTQSRFDATYQQVLRMVAKSRHARRSIVQKNLSVSAAATVAEHSLDFAYIDARHDYDGVLEDLKAWWPKLCPGGLLAGHDYDNVMFMPVPRAVGDFVRGLGAAADGTVPTLFITADHPASWFLFKPPRACTDRVWLTSKSTALKCSK